MSYFVKNGFSNFTVRPRSLGILTPIVFGGKNLHFRRLSYLGDIPDAICINPKVFQSIRHSLFSTACNIFAAILLVASAPRAILEGISLKIRSSSVR
jgi:hypothetical protein